MHTAILILNLVASLASAAWAAVALVRPASLSREIDIARVDGFYVRMYAARAIPFGLAAGILPFFLGGKAVAWVLFTAAAIQVADVMIAVGKKEKGMIVGASLGAVVHIRCGVAIM